MLFWLFLFMMCFMGWRAYVYYEDQRMVAAGLAGLGGLLFAAGIGITFGEASQDAPTAVAAAAEQSEGKIKRRPIDEVMAELSEGQIKSFCGIESYGGGPTTLPQDVLSHPDLPNWATSGGCEEVMAAAEWSEPPDKKETEEDIGRPIDMDADFE